jgi:hypothetical protein
VHQQADVVAGADAEVAEGMRQPVCALVELAVGQAALVADERLAVGVRVGRGLEAVGDVEASYGASLPWRT